MSTDAPAMAPPKQPRTSIRRPSSEASRFHMSKEAVDRSVAEPLAWTDLKCTKHLAKMRWGDVRNVVCPHCNTGAEHYWSQKELRWKCKACGSRFSVTSKTVFAGRRIPLQVLIAAVHLWASGAAGQPALELRRMLALKGYNTAFTLVSRLREGLLRGFNVGLMSGLVEMDGAHASGRRASEKRGRPLPVRKTSEEEARADALLTSAARSKKKREEKRAALAAGGHVVNTDNGAVFPAARRIVFTCRRKSGQKGKGACMTRIGVGMGETPDVAQALAEACVHEAGQGVPAAPAGQPQRDACWTQRRAREQRRGVHGAPGPFRKGRVPEHRAQVPDRLCGRDCFP
jgi:transposase-like protein